MDRQQLLALVLAALLVGSSVFVYVGTAVFF
jgi:hypothetical protein